MKIPRYWAKERYEGKDRQGRRQVFVAGGWSFSSLQEAKDAARARAIRVCDLFARGLKPDTYEYHDRPIREEIVEEVNDGDTQIAMMTRNRYGALVLNTSNVLFVDVDFPKTGRGGFIESILLAFSRKKKEAKWQAAIQETMLEVQHWSERNLSRSFRQYRTREGLRLLFTDRLYDPTSAETASLLRGLKADPLYVMLTEKQECFRARLTSKPWRCGFSRPPKGFPWADTKAERAYRRWETEYTKKDSNYRVCELIRVFGDTADDAALRIVVALHDRMSRIESNAPLA